MSKFIKNVGYLGFVQVVNYVFPLISVPYVSRIIGPESYGIINYATTFIGYFIILIGYGFDLTGTRKIARNPEDLTHRNAVYSEILNARLVLFVLSIILFIISIILVEPLRNDITVSVLLFLMCISNVIAPNYIYHGMQNLVVYAKVNFIRGLLYTVLIFVFIKEEKDYVNIVAINCILTIVSSMFYYLYAIKIYKLNFIYQPIKKVILFIWDERVVFFSTVVISFYTTTNVVLLGFFDSIENVAYFTTSLNLVNISTSVLLAPISAALYPYLSTAFAISKQNGLDVAVRILPVLFYVITISCLALFVFAPIIVLTLYGNEFGNTVMPMQIMAFSPLIISLSNFFGIQIMLNLNLDKEFLKILSYCSIFGILCNLLLSTEYGFIGTAYNVILVETVVTSATYIALKRRGINIIKIQYFRPTEIWNQIKFVLITRRKGKQYHCKSL